MPLSKVSAARLKEIGAIPDSKIDTSEIPELDEEFWENAKMVVPKNYLRVDSASWSGSRRKGKTTKHGSTRCFVTMLPKRRSIEANLSENTCNLIYRIGGDS